MMRLCCIPTLACPAPVYYTLLFSTIRRVCRPSSTSVSVSVSIRLKCPLTHTLQSSLAYMEMRLILAHVLWRFDLQLAPGLKYEKGWIREQRMMGLWEKVPLMVDVKERVLRE